MMHSFGGVRMASQRATDEPKQARLSIASDKPARVALEGVGKTFGTFQALGDINLTIADGEIVSLLGPSGCGKTTLMRLIAGFDRPTTGTIRIDGDDVVDMAPERRPVNMVFQRYALFPHLDVFHNVAFGLKVKGVRGRELKDRVWKMLHIVQLEKLAARPISALSGGQSQRVALARALVNRPKVLLLDEPLAALDLKIRQHMLLEMKRIHNETGATFVYVTHDQDEALVLSDRIALMDHGVLMQLDDPQTMYARPRSVFAARFLGETNLMHVVIAARDGSQIVAKTESGLEIISRQPCDVPVGQKAVAAIRPELLSFVAPSAAPAHTASCVVRDFTFIGSRSIWTIVLDDGTEVSVQSQGPRTDNTRTIGARLRIAWDPAHVVILADDGTGD